MISSTQSVAAGRDAGVRPPRPAEPITMGGIGGAAADAAGLGARAVDRAGVERRDDPVVRRPVVGPTAGRRTVAGRLTVTIAGGGGAAPGAIASALATGPVGAVARSGPGPCARSAAD
jgi:hypothetical protein